MFTFLFLFEQDGRTSPLNQNDFNIVIFLKWAAKKSYILFNEPYTEDSIEYPWATI